MPARSEAPGPALTLSSPTPPSASKIGNQDPVLILRILAGSITGLDKENDHDQAELFGGHDRRFSAAGQA
jgi:hypothetical protein